MNLKFLYTDDKTGAFSDTTLRTWIVFGVFIIYALMLCAAHILVIAGVLTAHVPDNILDSALALFDALGVIVFGSGILYLGKRINERKAGLFPTTSPDGAPAGADVKPGDKPC